MLRNMDKRVEIAAPIWNVNYIREIVQLFDIQWRDNVKARIIDSAQKNKFRKLPKGEQRMDSQSELHQLHTTPKNNVS